MFRGRFKYICLLVATAVFSACSSTPSPQAQFHTLDSEAKEALILNYPELSAEQRASLLGAGEDAPQVLAGWVSEDEALKKTIGPRLKMSPEQRHDHDLVRIELRGDDSKLRAYALYRDSREADVSADVKWEFNPPLGSLSPDGAIQWRCAASDVVVSASFFGEWQAERTFSPARKVTRLEIQISGATQFIDSLQTTNLVAIAHCEDGTSSEVTCQSQWNVRSPNIEISGCGHLRFLSSANPEALETLEASYGGITAQRKVSSYKAR
jgi:hypothetical protein